MKDKCIITEMFKRLVELRKLEHVSLVETALAIGVSAGHLSNCERGFAILTDAQLAKLEQFLTGKIQQRVIRLERI
ncbi:MAG TPA: helix-turn-helix transcriptional regulator [Candidatus Acidoferrum sp.]|nr:helix-turn-helix transcriptional regulator [Candidatus Acidoferrum sp.]